MAPMSVRPILRAGPTGELARRWLRDRFPRIQAAWAERDLGELRRYATGRLAARMEADVAELRREGLANRVEDAWLRDVRVLSEQGDDAVVLAVAFVARDWVEDADGELIEGDDERLTPFRQRWRLVPRGRRDWLVDDVAPADES